MIVESGAESPHLEPCLICGEETAVGSVFFSDRREAVLPDGTRGFLCSECIRRLRAKGRSEVSEERLLEGSVITLTMAVL